MEMLKFSVQRRWLRRLLPAVLWVLVFSPAIFMSEVVREKSVDVLCFDDWENVPMLKKWRDGTLEWSDLWSLQIQHRPVVPRLLVIALMELSGGDNRAQQGLSFGLSVLIAVVVALLLSRSLGASRWVKPAAFVGVTLIVSPVLFQNFLWATLFWMAIPPLCAVSMMLCLRARADEAALRWSRWGGGLVLAVIGTLSFSHGLALWPLLVCYLVLQPDLGPMRRRLTMAGAAGAIGAVLIAAYFRDFRNLSTHAYELQVGEHALGHMVDVFQAENFARVLRFACGLVGNGLARSAFDSHDLVARSQWLGALGLGVFAACGVVGIFTSFGRAALRECLPWLAIGGFGLAVAFAVAVGRAHLGEHRCTVPRYLVGTGLVWVASLAAGGLLFRSWARSVGVQNRVAAIRPIGAAALVGASVWQVSIWEYGLHLCEVWSQARHQARAILRFVKHEEVMPWSIYTLDNTYPFVRDAAVTMEELGLIRTKLLSEARLSKFRREKSRLPLGRAMVEHVGVKDGVMTVIGYGRFGPRRPADLIAFTAEDGDRVLGIGVPRPRTLLRLFNVDYEFTNFYDVPLGEMSFWEARIPLERLVGVRKLWVWALDEERGRVARFERRLDVP